MKLNTENFVHVNDFTMKNAQNKSKSRAADAKYASYV